MLGVGKLIKEAQKMQAKVQEMQENLAQQSFSANAAWNAVKVTVNGRGEITSLDLDAEFLKKDSKGVSQAIIEAVTKAQKAANAASEAQMKALSNPLKGLFG
jgi:nucleoid-associated protein EbfC